MSEYTKCVIKPIESVNNNINDIDKAEPSLSVYTKKEVDWRVATRGVKSSVELNDSNNFKL